jgi:radical SAM superfamily enzyme YgiQ (UPF0313 family)
MGLGYLAGSLLAAGYDDLTLYDAAVETESIAEVLQRAQRAGRPYDIAGISSPTPLINEAWEAAREAKEAGAVTILGGPHLTLMPDESIERPEVDLVVRGEAEETLVEIVGEIERQSGASGSLRLAKGNLAAILGLSWKKDSGEVMHNPPRPLRDDLDNIPFPAHHMYKIDRYTNLQPLTDGLDPNARAYTLVTSRGCPFTCTFCSKPITGDTWRPRSVENVVEEWRWLVEDLRATEIGITDDIWNRDVGRAKELCQVLIREGLNTVPWVTVHGMKVNYGDPELFRLMKAAGAKRVGFGVESGDEYILSRVVRKGQTLAQVRNAFQWAKEAGLQTMGFFVFGMPEETEETMEKTTRLALELDPDLANFMIAAPYPGTKLYELIEREGDIFGHDWTSYAIHTDRAKFEIGDLKAELVERKWREAYRRFYWRPKRLARRLMMPDTWRHLPARLRDAKRFFVGDREAGGAAKTAA